MGRTLIETVIPVAVASEGTWGAQDLRYKPNKPDEGS